MRRPWPRSHAVADLGGARQRHQGQSRQTDRQRQADIQTNRRTDGQTERERERQARETERQSESGRETERVQEWGMTKARRKGLVSRPQAACSCKSGDWLRTGSDCAGL